MDPTSRNQMLLFILGTLLLAGILAFAAGTMLKEWQDPQGQECQANPKECLPKEPFRTLGILAVIFAAVCGGSSLTSAAILAVYSWLLPPLPPPTNGKLNGPGPSFRLSASPKPEDLFQDLK